MRLQINEKQRTIVKASIWTFSICLLIGIGIWRLHDIAAVIGKVLSVLAPVIIGLVFAYLLSPLANWMEKQVQLLTDRKKPHPRLTRALAVALTMLLLFAAIVGLVASIVPELISSVKNLLVSLPDYLTSVTNWITRRIAGLKEEQPQMYSGLMTVWDSVQNGLNNYADQFEPKLDSIISGGGDFLAVVTTSAAAIITWLKNFLLGMIITIYLLYNKETYLAQTRKFMYAMMPTERVHSFLRVGSHVSYTFMHFLSGKSLDSLIIGLLCFIGMSILGMPYTTLISILVGVTNIIPFFGPFIGAVPSALLILLSEPKKVIPFVIFILILQQFDGNILGPKILGDSLGLPMFWILFAIIVGGGLFGFVGIIAFVPLFAAVYTLFSDFLNDRLADKGLPAETESYMTNEIHFADKSAAEKAKQETEQPDEAEQPENPENQEDAAEQEAPAPEEAPETEDPQHTEETEESD